MISLGRFSANKSSTYHPYHVRPAADGNSSGGHEHYSCTVHFLDDTERTFFIDRQHKGLDLLNEIFDYLDLAAERKYFGLLIEDLTQDFAYRWLEASKSLRKLFLASQSSYHLYFKVRFFPTDPTAQITDEFTRYLFVLQIKKELLSGKLWCSRSVSALLASYIVQSELGDFNTNAHRDGYLSDFRFVPFQNQDFENEVQQYHKQHRGQSPADTELNYLRVASTLDMYGVELHKASVKVSDTSHSIYNSTVELYVGVCAIGISIFQNSTRINIFSWDRITKISFKRRTFYVQLIKHLNSADDNSIVFTLRNYRCCKYLWKSCVDHHTFFRLSSIPLSPKKFFSLANSSRPSKNSIANGSFTVTEDKKRKIFDRVSSRRNHQARHMPTGASTLPVTSANNSLVINMNSNLPSVLYRSSSSVSVCKSDELAVNAANYSPPPKPPRQSCHVTKVSQQHSSIINSVIREANEYKPKNAVSPQAEGRDSVLQLETSNLILIKLQPDTDGRYGFNVKGGRQEHAPISVSRVVPSTPAHRAALHEGDIIVAINDIDIGSYSHEEVVNLIRQSRDRLANELELRVKLVHDSHIARASTTSITVEESLQRLRDDLKSHLLIEQYGMLPRRKAEFTFDVAADHENYSRNRYKDVLPYDQTRVILATELENDYINASYINIPISNTEMVNRYIATQGPLPTTCDAFWKMIWEQECTLILMLTPLFESGRAKCHQYWPNVFDSLDYGRFNVRCRRERKDNDLIYREFSILNKDLSEERFIYQIQNETWPDHGVPNDYGLFVDFILEIRELRKSKRHAPVLVHCSAGIGRTGVVILMETALCLMETNQPVYPLDTVRLMREQRVGMIQTASQYQFACEAILYAYDHGLVETSRA